MGVMESREWKMSTRGLVLTSVGEAWWSRFEGDKGTLLAKLGSMIRCGEGEELNSSTEEDVLEGFGLGGVVSGVEVIGITIG